MDVEGDTLTLGLTKPMGEYKDFDDCVAKNKDKGDPQAYCASIMRKIEGKARTVGGYESPEPGDLPEKGKKILAETYASCRKDGGDKEKCSKIAWGAVERAGYKTTEANLNKEIKDNDKRILYIPLIKESNKILAVISDDSIDRDDEFMSKSLINEFAKNEIIPALIIHENKMESWAGAFKNPKVKEKTIDGVTRSMVEAEFIPSTTNPNTKWIADAIKEADEMGLKFGVSIGAIPLDYETIKRGNKDYKMWTKAEWCEASIIPFGSNRNAQIAIAKAMRNYQNFMEANKMEDIKSKPEELDLTKKPEEKPKEPEAPKEPETPKVEPELAKKVEVKEEVKPLIKKAPIELKALDEEIKEVTLPMLLKKAYKWR